MQAYFELRAWPDVPPALAGLKKRGLRLAFLSNMTPKMLASNIKSAKLDGIFDQVLSTDPIRTYKPDPRAYQMAIDALGLKREEILFVPFAGWDAAGAKWFGYRTFWVNRLGLPPEELGVAVDASASSLSDIEKFLNV
jgi:2-haloacid dehalogenase